MENKMLKAQETKDMAEVEEKNKDILREARNRELSAEARCGEAMAVAKDLRAKMENMENRLHGSVVMAVAADLHPKTEAPKAESWFQQMQDLRDTNKRLETSNETLREFVNS